MNGGFRMVDEALEALGALTSRLEDGGPSLGEGLGALKDFCALVAALVSPETNE